MGRPKKAKIKDAIDGQYAAKPSKFMYEEVAKSLNIDRKEIPVFEEVQQLQAWAFMIRALRGSHEHARELLDRSDPKPSRSTIDVKVNREPSQAASVSDEDAKDYYGRLAGEGEDE